MTWRESWCPVGERTYTSRGVRPRVQLVQHHHRCPDRTRVVVLAQYVEITDTTLYRWTVGGVRARSTSAAGDVREIAPDWSVVDGMHTCAAA